MLKWQVRCSATETRYKDTTYKKAKGANKERKRAANCGEYAAERDNVQENLLNRISLHRSDYRVAVKVDVIDWIILKNGS